MSAEPNDLPSAASGTDSDAMLVQRAVAGDPSAFELLVIKYQRRIQRLIGRMVRDVDLVEDIAQETFIRAYRALHQFRGDAQFYTWLYRIAVNTAKNYLTSQGRRPPSSDVEADEAEYYGGGEALQEVATPENLALTDEIKRTVFSAIEALPEDLRTAITLREMEGLSYEEIAEIMDCPVGTVRSRIFRAREAIDKKLKPLIEN